VLQTSNSVNRSKRKINWYYIRSTRMELCYRLLQLMKTKSSLCRSWT